MEPRVLLPRATPDEVGLDPAGIDAFVDGLARRRIEMHSLLVVRHGRVCAEGYWTPHAPQHAPLLYSLSKTFTSAAVGLAVADGLFGYEDRLVDLFADVVDVAGPVASRIRVRDCLAMATGHTVDVVPTLGLARAPGRLPWRAALADEPAGNPGTTFQYNQFATWTLAEIVRHASGRTVLDWLIERVFDPLGIKGATWDTDQRGRLLGYSGLHLAPEAVASFFQLLLEDGVRDGERLLPVQWITEYARLQVATPDETAPDWGQGYGWQVWRDTRGGHRGDGAFGQFGVLIPSRDAVVVTTAMTLRMQEILDEVWGCLLPAFDRPSAEDGAGLEHRLRALALPTVGGERGGAVALSFESRTDRWRLLDDADGWTLRWVDARGGDNTLDVGFGQWRTSTMRWGGRTLRVAASGGWVAWGHWLAHLVVLDAPHALLIRLRDDGSGRLEWVESAPLGVPDLADLATAPA